MSAGTIWRANRPRLAGLAFVVLLLAALTLSVLVYRKTFTPVLWVTLRADHTGLQLNPGADVKVRDVIVGEVRKISADGDNATLRLALQPADVHWVPGNVTARLLPKTLFGERYVALQVPGRPAAPIRDGAVIGQDRSSSALELEKVLDDMLPLLKTIAPDKLAATLGALAGALQGRGEQLGNNLASLDKYLAQLNPDMPTMRTDLVKLADTLQTYQGAADDLLAILRNSTVTMNTVVNQRDELAAFLADTTDTADTARGFLNRHGDRIIQLGQVSKPLLDLLATYAPEYPCLLAGLARQEPRIVQVFRNGRMHITIEAVRDNGKYVRGKDDPVYHAGGGPNCRGLPNPKVPAPEVPVGDGYDWGASRTPAPAQNGIAPASMGYAGTPEESGVIDVLVGAQTGTPPDQVPASADLLWGPVYRGTVVTQG